jgi:dUTP pyrophosphatase
MKKIKIKLFDEKCMPYKKRKSDSGFDLRARLDNRIVIPPHGSSDLIPSGVAIELPIGYEAQVRPRSGLGVKYDIVSLLGTIDSEYRGEIGIKLFNFSYKPFVVRPYERICQLVIQKVELPEIEVVDELKQTDRGQNGFGSTGVE